MKDLKIVFTMVPHNLVGLGLGFVMELLPDQEAQTRMWLSILDLVFFIRAVPFEIWSQAYRNNIGSLKEQFQTLCHLTNFLAEMNSSFLGATSSVHIK